MCQVSAAPDESKFALRGLLVTQSRRLKELYVSSERSKVISLIGQQQYSGQESRGVGLVAYSFVIVQFIKPVYRQCFCMDLTGLYKLCKVIINGPFIRQINKKYRHFLPKISITYKQCIFIMIMS
jgi:hypothetical protein